MTYLLWGILNIGLLLFFIVICFRATKLIREKIGLFASVIFVLGLLSFISGSGNDDNRQPNSSQIKTWEFNKEKNLNTNETHLLNISLEKSLASENVLVIKYGQERQQKSKIPISAYSDMTGLRSGTTWNPSIIVVNKTTDNNKFEYFVSGVVKWKLLGATIYSQPKDYMGIAMTE
jgi:hypothetical protein